MNTPDADDELTTWQEVQAMDHSALQAERDERHRCAADSPPCPDCQELDDQDV